GRLGIGCCQNSGGTGAVSDTVIDAENLEVRTMDIDTLMLDCERRCPLLYRAIRGRREKHRRSQILEFLNAVPKSLINPYEITFNHIRHSHHRNEPGCVPRPARCIAAGNRTTGELNCQAAETVAGA